MSRKDVNDLYEAARDTLGKAQDAATSAVDQIDAGLESASHTIVHTSAQVANQAYQLWSELKAATAQGTAQLQEWEDRGVVAAREQVKEGIAWAQEYPYAAYGIAASSLLLFPGPRTYLIRNVFGFMQSQESLYRSATEQSKAFKVSVESLLKEKETLSEKAAETLQELAAAQTRVTAAKADLLDLSTRMAASTSSMQDVPLQLKGIKAQEAVNLRSEIMRDIAEVASQKRNVDSVIAKMANKSL